MKAFRERKRQRNQKEEEQDQDLVMREGEGDIDQETTGIEGSKPISKAFSLLLLFQKGEDIQLVHHQAAQNQIQATDHKKRLRRVKLKD